MSYYDDTESILQREARRQYDARYPVTAQNFTGNWEDYFPPLREPITKPEANTYHLAVELTAVSKADALKFAEALRVLAENELPGTGVVVTVAHVKGVTVDV